VPSPAERSRSTLGVLHLLVAAAIVVPALLFAAAAWQNRGQVLGSAEGSVRKTSAILHEHALKVIETHELLMAEIDQAIKGKDWATIERSPEIAELLQRLRRDFAQVLSLWLVDGEGRVRLSSTRQGAPNDLDLSGRLYFVVQRQRDQGTYVSDAFPSLTTGRMIFSLSRRRTTANGDFDGIIVVTVDSNYFSDFYRTVDTTNNFAVALVHAGGAILARYPAADDRPLRLDENSGLLRAIAAGQEAGSFWARSQIDGVNRFFSFEKLKGYPLYVIYGVAERAILREWYRNALIYGAVAFPASLALLIVAWVALERARHEAAATALLEEEMRRREVAEAAFLQAQKMEAVGQLTGGIAHDFNNLLTVISGNLELLQRSTLDERQTRMVAAAQRAARRGEGLSQHLLVFSRRQALRPVDFTIGERLLDLRELLERSLRDDIELVVDAPAETWPIHADPAQLDLAILNIAVNARDAMPNGGKLTIVARNLVLPRDDGAPSLVGEFVALKVSDTGTGMSAEIKARVFEPFFTTKEVGKGTGLGLSQVYGFATQSSGTAAIDSAPQRGTTVTIYLPRAASSLLDEAQRRAAAPPVDGGLRVLLVEDDDEVAELATLLLGELGHRVVRAASATAALEQLQHNTAFDIVFSDIVMPGMSGLDLAHEIRRRWPDLPVVLTTGYSSSAEAAGRDEFPILPKPYDAATLRRVLASRTRLAPSA
jgi:two-component system, NtrC family, sensor kinase